MKIYGINQNNFAAKQCVGDPAMVSQIQVGNTVTQAPGLDPAQDYNVDCSELEITCGYSNSRAQGVIVANKSSFASLEKHYNTE